jgi:hypothetical protein
MQFVLTPVQQCAFTQSRPERVTPYFSSCHFTNLLTLNPVLSTAKSVSRAASGIAERETISVSAGVMSSSQKNSQTLLGWIDRDKWPISSASPMSQAQRREDTPQ